MDQRYIYASLSRIANFEDSGFELKEVDRSEWTNGDYIVGRSLTSHSPLFVELTDGRTIHSMEGDLIVGALGVRYATLEATGTWEDIGKDGKMEMLTGAGLIGVCTSKSFYIPDLIGLKYKGHVHIDGKRCNMRDFAQKAAEIKYNTPTIVMFGTSMSAGKTASARIIIRELVNAGLNVVGAKLTGAGRYRDILSMRDVGAAKIFDFVDAGLPSSICDPNYYRKVLTELLSSIQGANADVAVVEIGASPLEPYNGDVAINAIKDNIAMSVLCASDPYAVYGVMKAFDVKPDLVSGIATNTFAGIDLIEKLCKVKALNLIDDNTKPELRKVLRNSLSMYN